MLRAKIRGRAAVFCGPACRDAFKADRDAGLIYGLSAIGLDNGRIYLCKNREEWSRLARLCAYCGLAPVEEGCRETA